LVKVIITTGLPLYGELGLTFYAHDSATYFFILYIVCYVYSVLLLLVAC